LQPPTDLTIKALNNDFESRLVEIREPAFLDIRPNLVALERVTVQELLEVLVVNWDPVNNSVQCFISSGQFAVHDHETVRLLNLIFKNCVLVTVLNKFTDFRLLLLRRIAFR
jgi:hypothetical protein